MLTGRKREIFDHFNSYVSSSYTFVTEFKCNNSYLKTNKQTNKPKESFSDFYILLFFILCLLATK